MKATFIPIIPPDAPTTMEWAAALGSNAGSGVSSLLPRISCGLAPEKLAACLARYSRNNEGIDVIIEKFKDKSPDEIFRFIDYGHASIGGLTGGIPIAVDGVSMLLAYKLFDFAQMADGQESSTRYITLDSTGLPSPDEIGIPTNLQPLWRETCAAGFEIYSFACEKLNAAVRENPAMARIPQGTSATVAARMHKNYALDRARYFLPLACKTNIALIASARVWADTILLIESLQWPEAMSLSRLLRAELEKAAPNLIRHSHADGASISYVSSLQREGQGVASAGVPVDSAECLCCVDVQMPPPRFSCAPVSVSDALASRSNRYSHAGLAIKRQTVRTEWSAVSIAELRDLNRHRNGFRFSDFSPRGFYLPSETASIVAEKAQPFLEQYQTLVQEMARTGSSGVYSYGLFLGTQVPFEHTQQGDKFLYEVELRTGAGAHFRYADHLRQAAALYFDKVPEAAPFIRLGAAEPE